MWMVSEVEADGVSLGLPRFLRQGFELVLVMSIRLKGHRAAIAKCGVKSGEVIEDLDIVEDRVAGFGSGGEALLIDQLVLEAASERFDVGVVATVCAAPHGGEQSVFGEDCAICPAGKLAAAVGVNDEPGGRPALHNGHAQRGDCQWSIKETADGVRFCGLWFLDACRAASLFAGCVHHGTRASPSPLGRSSSEFSN